MEQNYIRALLKPNGKQTGGKRVWSIDLESVWLPFFISTNTTGDTQLSDHAIGAPIRLAYNQDSSVKFSKAGRPVTKVVKDLSDQIRLIRENFIAGLQAHAGAVIAEYPEGYKAMIERARQAGKPIIEQDRHNLDKAILEAFEQAKEDSKPKGKVKVGATA